jgi:phage-related protein
MAKKEVLIKDMLSSITNLESDYNDSLDNIEKIIKKAEPEFKKFRKSQGNKINDMEQCFLDLAGENHNLADMIDYLMENQISSIMASLAFSSFIQEKGLIKEMMEYTKKMSEKFELIEEEELEKIQNQSKKETERMVLEFKPTSKHKTKK